MNLEELKSWIPDLDLEIIKEVIYCNGWSTYEEFGHVFIFKAFDDSFQKIDYGHNVFTGNWSDYMQEISEEQVKLEIEEMEKIIDQCEL